MVSITDELWFSDIEITEGHISPLYRQQTSTTQGGFSASVAQGQGLWTCGFTTVAMPLEDAYELETEIMSLEGSLGTVPIYDKQRPTPKNYVRATHGASGLSFYFTSISDDCRTLTLFPLSSAFNQYRLTPGDNFVMNVGTSRYYHRVTAVSGDQVTVWPTMSPLLLKTGGGFLTNQIFLNRPAARFRRDPSTLNRPLLSIDRATHNATVTFSGVQSLR